MADVEIPDDLLKLRRQFLAAEARLKNAGAVPASVWADMQAECRRLAVAIQEDPAWETVKDRKAVRRALDAMVGDGEGTDEA